MPDRSKGKSQTKRDTQKYIYIIYIIFLNKSEVKEIAIESRKKILCDLNTLRIPNYKWLEDINHHKKHHKKEETRVPMVLRMQQRITI